jgi:hypothetical protein
MQKSTNVASFTQSWYTTIMIINIATSSIISSSRNTISLSNINIISITSISIKFIVIIHSIVSADIITSAIIIIGLCLSIEVHIRTQHTYYDEEDCKRKFTLQSTLRCVHFLCRSENMHCKPAFEKGHRWTCRPCGREESGLASWPFSEHAPLPSWYWSLQYIRDPNRLGTPIYGVQQYSGNANILGTQYIGDPSILWSPIYWGPQ